ncbi:WGR and DUF4132 domain-containing protein [Aureimonas psammosilenae]|uniref:WGR and DUF4132 domain-containing protein n=1 Tax=Aureimonas psammosilenae TaxID=2495496 RepID=UPI00126094D9|nr:WGR and DUF4132 domain-containing protein [Aureimonas psammosilenae]
MERYELVEGSSAKFWAVAVEGETLTVRYGRIGTEGQSKDKTFPSAEAAEKERAKLIKEKTGKGYAAAGTIEAPAPKPARALEPEASLLTAGIPAAPTELQASAAPIPAEPEGSPELDAMVPLALPSRSRPTRFVTNENHWTELAKAVAVVATDWQADSESRETYRQYRQADEIARQKEMDRIAASSLQGDMTEPVGTPTLDQAESWLRDWAVYLENYELTIDRADGTQAHWKARDLATFEFLQWVLERQGMGFLAETVVRFAATGGADRRYGDTSWNDPVDLAMRHILSTVPGEDYETARERLVAASPRLDWRGRASLSFMLADESHAAHDLQPLAVLQGMAADGESPMDAVWAMPLIVEAPPEGAAPWRRKSAQPISFYHMSIDFPQIVASAIAAAKQAGQSPLQSLGWLQPLGYGPDPARVAGLMLATGEPEAVGLLLPIVHQKEIRAALDAAEEAAPGRTARQYLASLASGRTDPVLKARVGEMLRRHSTASLRAWAEGDSRSLAWLDRFLASRDVAIAPSEALPAVLRDPPWRRKAVKRTAAEPLTLQPIETPFRWERSGAKPDDQGWRLHDARIMATPDELVALIATIEAEPLDSWYKIPERSLPLPQAGDDWEAVCGYLAHRLTEIHRARAYALNRLGWMKLLNGIERQPEPLALTLWSLGGPMGSTYYWTPIFDHMMERFGERALPGLVRQLDASPITVLEGVGDVDAAGIAPGAARALAKLKKARVPAMAWLRRHRETAIARLIPDALGAPGPAREAAETALRWFAADRGDGRETIERIAAAYAGAEPGVPAALAEMLERDGLDQFPARVPKLPAWFDPARLARPQLRGGGGALSDEAIRALAEMLSFSAPDPAYPGIALVRDATTRESLAAFGWDLFSAWLAEGAPGKDNWALRALGQIGDDETARQLTRLIRRWPGEAAHARAVAGLDVLAEIGSDVALMNLNGIAEKLPFKGLQDKAREKIASLAEARDLTPEELADRLAPDLDLDERGGLDIDFGPRRFRVGFDEFLKPWVKDATGQRLKELPKPNRGDDAELAGAATKRWSALKKDARAIASLQIARLEEMLASSRRVSPAVFGRFFAGHPLIRHLAQRLVWGLYPDDAPLCAPSLLFRVADDLTLTDAADDPVELDTSEEAAGRIGLVHPLHLPPAGLDGFGTLFGDYEIAQPFAQLGRETFALTQAERDATELRRFAGIKVDTGRVRGMPARGWRLGAPQDGGCIWWIERSVRLAAGGSRIASFTFEQGLFAGAAEFEDKQQTLGVLSLGNVYAQAGSGTPFGQLDPVAASELLRGLTHLAEGGGL